MNHHISIVICTYNRCEILNEVLEHLCNNVKNIDKTEIIVVDNNSIDETKLIVERIQKNNTNVRYVFEEQQGLSYARNRGYKESSNIFVLYLDDDALADQSLIDTTDNIILSYPGIMAIGGIYTPWYRYGRPKWFKDEYASKRFNHQGIKILSGEETWSGGIMLIKKEILEKFSFDTALGMSGDKVFYGEETELQYRLEKNGIPVYGTNDMKIKHVVQSYKLNVPWFFKLKKAQAETMVVMNKKNSIVEVMKAIFSGFALIMVDGVKNIFKLFGKNYYFENYKIDTFTKPYKWWIYTLRNLGING